MIVEKRSRPNQKEKTPVPAVQESDADKADVRRHKRVVQLMAMRRGRRNDDDSFTNTFARERQALRNGRKPRTTLLDVALNYSGGNELLLKWAYVRLVEALTTPGSSLARKVLYHGPRRLGADRNGQNRFRRLSPREYRFLASSGTDHRNDPKLNLKLDLCWISPRDIPMGLQKRNETPPEALKTRKRGRPNKFEPVLAEAKRLIATTEVSLTVGKFSEQLARFSGLHGKPMKAKSIAIGLRKAGLIRNGKVLQAE